MIHDSRPFDRRPARLWSGREKETRGAAVILSFFSLSYAEMHRDKWRIHIPDSTDTSYYRLPRPSQSAGSVALIFI